MKLIRKITVRKCCALGAGEIAEAARQKRIELLALMGAATSMSQGRSDYGEFTKFRGQFEAKDLSAENGEHYVSAVAILPKVVEDILIAALSDPTNPVVKFAGIITAVPDKNPKGGVGWTYHFEPRVQAMSTSLLDEMRKEMKMLPAPETAEKKKK